MVAVRPPTLTWSVLRAALVAVRRLHDGMLTQAGLEKALEVIMVTSTHRRHYPDRGVRMPILDTLSLALDMDTEEEAAAAGARLADE